MNELEKQVKVTHFINPNQFFYLELSREKEIEVLKRKEVGYATYCADREPKDVQIKPQPDDVSKLDCQMMIRTFKYSPCRLFCISRRFL